MIDPKIITQWQSKPTQPVSPIIATRPVSNGTSPVHPLIPKRPSERFTPKPVRPMIPKRPSTDDSSGREFGRRPTIPASKPVNGSPDQALKAVQCVAPPSPSHGAIRPRALFVLDVDNLDGLRWETLQAFVASRLGVEL